MNDYSLLCNVDLTGKIEKLNTSDQNEVKKCSFTSMALFFRGSGITAAERTAAVNHILNPGPVPQPHLSCNTKNIPTYHCSKEPVKIGEQDLKITNNQVMMLANHTGMRQIFRVISHKFDLLCQHDCYQQLYIGAGAGQSDLENARMNIAELERDYLGVGLQCSGKTQDQIREQDQEEKDAFDATLA